MLNQEEPRNNAIYTLEIMAWPEWRFFCLLWFLRVEGHRKGRFLWSEGQNANAFIQIIGERELSTTVIQDS